LPRSGERADPHHRSGPLSGERADPRDVHTDAHASTVPRDRLLAFWEGGFAAFPLPPSGKVTVGRLQECEVRVDHPSVSRRHAELLLGPQLRVVDLGSFNGTRVGGVRIASNEPTLVPPRSVLEVGSAFLVVEAGARAAAAGPTLRPPPPGTAEQETDLVVTDERMLQLHRLLRAVAQGTISVLLLGETGVGKEVIAQSIHRYSPRASRPFVSINCAAIPEALLESELFGHERGAFTGAVREKTGLLETAEGGTLFLDEVGEMPLPAQAKLLRAIELRQIVRVGGVRPRPVDVRFVSATNRDVEELIAARSFRRDLFFRLNGISVSVPPLRERVAELDGLAARFLTEFSASLGRGHLALSEAALHRLRSHAWPGNVRELRNVIERAVLLCDGRQILPEHLSLEPTGAVGTEPARAEHVPPPPSLMATTPFGRAAAIPTPPDVWPQSALSEELQATERRRILEALERCAGNQTRAAEMLGISRRVLIHRLEAYGVPRPRKRG
jgi:transcriptional regulator with PAS, ATPase and Fis domain